MHSETARGGGTLHRALPGALLALLLVLAFHGALSGRRFFLRDIVQNHHPVRALVTERLLSGEPPLWDPYHGGGTPLLANPNSLVLHPITLLFFVLPFEAAFSASVVLQFALLAAGGYLLARALALRREAALLAAAVLLLSGPAASMASMQNVLSAAAFVPLALWAGVRGLEPGRRWLLAVATPCAAVVLIAAEPACVLALVLPGLVLAGTASAPAARPAWNRRACAAFAGVLLLAAVVAAVQLAPAASLLSLSQRVAGFAPAEGLKWSLLPERLPELIVPRLFGDPTRLSPASWWGGFLFEGRYPFLLSIYVGAIPCLLACVGILHRGAHLARRRALGAVAALALLLALGRDSAIYRTLFEHLAPLRQVRYPERFVLVFLFAAAILAGYGLDRLLAARPSRRAAASLVGAAAALFALCVVAATAPLADRVLAALARVPASFLASEGGAQVRGALLRSSLWAFGEAAALAGLASYAARRPLPGRSSAAALGLVVLASISMCHATAPARSTAAPGWLLDPSPLAGAVGHGPGAPRLHHAPRSPDLAVWGRTDELVWGYRYDRFVYALMTGHAGRVPTALDSATDRMDLSASADLGRALESWPLAGRVRALAAARVGFLLSYDALADPGLEPGPVLEGFSRPPARLYRLRAVVPRLRFVTRARRLPPGGDIAAALADPGYDAARAVLLDDPPAGADQEDESRGGPGAPGGDTAEIVEETAERIVMRVRAARAGYLVLADAFAPGWRAALDGRDAPILRADGLFRAVAVPPGRHVLEMTYRPGGLLSGALLCALGLSLSAAWGVAAFRRGL